MRRTASMQRTSHPVQSPHAYGRLLQFASAFQKDFSAIVPREWVPGLLPATARHGSPATEPGAASRRIASVGIPGPADVPARIPGAEVRLLSAAPVCLAIGDRRTVFISPAPWHESGRAWITTDPQYVQTAKGFFELAWCGARANAPSSTATTKRRSAILLWLAKGLTDAAIAKRLNVTDRTVRREINSLMIEAGATTRFQLGLRVALGELALPPLAGRAGEAAGRESGVSA
ncbi:helix-turn-helix domain-containing protein [Streptomonospora sediminis]